MKIAYHDGRLFAIPAFFLCISATLAILLGDVFSGTVQFALKHYLALVVLFCTILFGLIAKKAGWLDPKKYGFWVLFWMGTILIAYSSIGRQSETMTVTASQAEQDAIDRKDTKAELASNKAMLKEANAKLAKECATGDGKNCKGIARTITVYTAAVAGNEATLLRLGPAKPVAPEADKTAEVLASFGYDATRTKALAVLLQPIGYFAFLEYGSILSLGFLLGGQPRKAKGLQPQPQPLKEPVVTVEKPTAEATMAPVSLSESAQTSFPIPAPRDFPALREAGLLDQDGKLFKAPDRWTYEPSLAVEEKPNPRRIN